MLDAMSNGWIATTSFIQLFYNRKNQQDDDLQSIIFIFSFWMMMKEMQSHFYQLETIGLVDKVLSPNSHVEFLWILWWHWVVGYYSTYGQYADDSTFEIVPTWQNKMQAIMYEDSSLPEHLITHRLLIMLRLSIPRGHDNFAGYLDIDLI